MVASSLGLSILGIVATLIAANAGVDTNAGVWLTVKVLPAVGLILGVAFLIAFVVASAIRRSRAARDAAN